MSVLVTTISDSPLPVRSDDRPCTCIKCRQSYWRSDSKQIVTICDPFGDAIQEIECCPVCTAMLLAGIITWCQQQADPLVLLAAVGPKGGVV